MRTSLIVKPNWKLFYFFIGCISFICAAAFVLIHLGFINEHTNHNPNPDHFLPNSQIWITNIILGGIGGLFIAPRKHVISFICGSVSSLAITGISLIYLGWRSNILMIEIIIPLGLGILPGIFLYRKITSP